LGVSGGEKLSAESGQYEQVQKMGGEQKKEDFRQSLSPTTKNSPDCVAPPLKTMRKGMKTGKEKKKKSTER